MLRRLLTACLSFVLAGFVFSSETSETWVERVHFLIPPGQEAVGMAPPAPSGAS